MQGMSCGHVLMWGFMLAAAGGAGAADRILSPDETRKRIQVPAGFEVRLFAAEPLVMNPTAMTWDARGRLWVTERHTTTNESDRIRIIEDTDADGRADKATLFADKLSFASGIALGNGGAYVGAGRKLIFLEDNDGDDKADRSVILKIVSGTKQEHAVLHAFRWGPDGWLYMTHDANTPSQVADPGATKDNGVTIQGGVIRFHPATKEFEVFADGPSHSRSLDWNESGDAFVSASGGKHLFHVAPAGQYHRESGTWENPYGYARDLPGRGLPAIADWCHERPGHAGITVYQGDQWPAEWRGLVILANALEGGLHCDRLSRVGSTYKAEKESTLLGAAAEETNSVGPGNFLVSGEALTPIDIQTGPDGTIWMLDSAHVDPAYGGTPSARTEQGSELGRIWRVIWVGEERGKQVPSRRGVNMNLSALSTDELAALLEHENIWQRRTAQRLLSARRDLRLGAGIHGSSKVHKLAESEKDIRFRLAALWALHAANELEDDFLRALDKDEEPAMRAWVARLTGERGFAFGAAMQRLARLAKDTNASVRLAVAVAARQFVSGTLTVNTPPTIALREVITGGVLSDLQKSPIVPGDPVLPFVYWMALEPIVAVDPAGALGFLENAKDSSLSKWPMNNYVLVRIMRRICDLPDGARREKDLNYAMKVLGGLAPETQLADAALDGLIAGLRESGRPPTIPLEPIFGQLAKNPAVAEKARVLATLLAK